MTVPKILAIFVVLLMVNLAAMLTGMVYQLTEGARALGVAQYLGWFILPAAIDGLLIAVLAVFVQVLSPNKYVGWGILFVWFVGAHLPAATWAIRTRSTLTAARPTCRSATSSAPGSFWIGADVCNSTGCAAR